MKIPAVLIVVLAILIGVVPHFNNCYFDGKTLALANGKVVPMKCYWSAQAEIAVAVPLLGVGVLMFLSRRRETLRALAALGALLGAFALLIPAALIGACSMGGASCNLVMKPAMALAGIVAIAASLGGLLLAERMLPREA